MTNKTVYFPGLNGLRAISAIGVVLGHITLSLKEFNLDPFIFGAKPDGTPKGLYIGGYGVSVFFVLSGFLITYLLQEEKQLQKINIKKFYLRRILRIWPLYYLYLAVAVLCIFLFNLELNQDSLLFNIFYAPNIPFILGTTMPFLYHYWSLGVEEQFYLFWPWVNKARRLIAVIIVLIIVLFGTKIFLHFFYPNTFLEATITITRFHIMMIGGLGAILYRQRNALFLKLTGNVVTQMICWLVIFLIIINKFHLASIVDTEILAGIVVCIIIGQINSNNKIINLEKPVLDYLGKISYGIYVVHPLLIYLFSRVLGSLEIQPRYKYPIVFFAVLLATIILAHLSYTYYEKYFINLKKKFMVVKSSSSRTASTT